MTKEIFISDDVFYNFVIPYLDYAGMARLFISAHKFRENDFLKKELLKRLAENFNLNETQLANFVAIHCKESLPSFLNGLDTEVKIFFHHCEQAKVDIHLKDFNQDLFKFPVNDLMLTSLECMAYSGFQRLVWLVLQPHKNSDNFSLTCAHLIYIATLNSDLETTSQIKFIASLCDYAKPDIDSCLDVFRNQLHSSALGLAINKLNVAVIKLLLEKGADPDVLLNHTLCILQTARDLALQKIADLSNKKTCETSPLSVQEVEALDNTIFALEALFRKPVSRSSCSIS